MSRTTDIAAAIALAVAGPRFLTDARLREQAKVKFAARVERYSK
jgi:hypothetical protein